MSSNLRGKHLHAQARETAFNVYQWIKFQNEDQSTKEIKENVSRATGVSVRTIERIIKEGITSPEAETDKRFKSPEKKKKFGCPRVLLEYTEDTNNLAKLFVIDFIKTIKPMLISTMDVDSIESCATKSEMILTETFSFYGHHRDYDEIELKTEPVDYEESFKCKEEDISAEQTGTHAAPMQPFSYNECDLTTQFSSVKKHFGMHKGIDDKYIIEQCNFQTLQNFCLTPQRKTSKSVDKYICNECNYTTLIKSYLRRHVKIHKGAEYKCKECDYKTVRKDHLKEHVNIHTGYEYKCKECDYKSAWQSSLKEHVKIHTDDEYKCKECDYKTAWQSSLKEHVKIHTGDEYKCKECDYKTAWQCSLKEHIKIHTGDEYKCKQCDYKTVRKNYIKEHVKIHTGDEYKCKECNYKTVRKDCLKEHAKIHTGDEYKCKECDYKTVWQSNLKKHIKIHTDDQYECTECDYKTVWQSSLKKHMKRHG
ncbi:hypothetical protein FQA39_LY04306 [Lamprigera yunnana]|nr:hypothetical protein FQA39_LY04306 [Lamprigera yunnana]